mgnify:CR=1
MSRNTELVARLKNKEVLSLIYSMNGKRKRQLVDKIFKVMGSIKYKPFNLR